MRISYVGNCKNKASDGKSYNTETHISLTLIKLGHKINFIQEDEIEFGTLPSRVEGADMFLHTRTWPGKVIEADLRAIEKMGIPTVSFHLDAYALIARNGGIGEDAFWKSQYIFSPENSVQARKVFKQHNINQYYLPPAVFEDEAYMAEPVGKYKHDITFVGGGVEYQHPEWEYRGELITWLQVQYGDRFVKYGYPQETIRGEELNKLYSSSKIVIGDSLNKDYIDSFYFSDRAFEVTGRGGFLIHPYVPGITDHFIDRKEIVLYGYRNFIQLRNLIDYYLVNDDEREAIRVAGNERTKTKNTYTQRMQQMLSVLKDEGAI